MLTLVISYETWFVGVTLKSKMWKMKVTDFYIFSHFCCLPSGGEVSEINKQVYEKPRKKIDSLI